MGAQGNRETAGAPWGYQSSGMAIGTYAQAYQESACDVDKGRSNTLQLHPNISRYEHSYASVAAFPTPWLVKKLLGRGKRVDYCRCCDDLFIQQTQARRTGIYRRRAHGAPSEYEQASLKVDIVRKFPLTPTYTVTVAVSRLHSKCHCRSIKHLRTRHGPRSKTHDSKSNDGARLHPQIRFHNTPGLYNPGHPTLSCCFTEAAASACWGALPPQMRLCSVVTRSDTAAVPQRAWRALVPLSGARQHVMQSRANEEKSSRIPLRQISHV
ncbi:hypothetical protein BKA63DRAFT_66720 [Paraphoma chrysanthemicola]|nr:hypothetical protein BKA63DRAFT_66720 [Paraphoma chrysanthemicola]